MKSNANAQPHQCYEPIASHCLIWAISLLDSPVDVEQLMGVWIDSPPFALHESEIAYLSQCEAIGL